MNDHMLVHFPACDARLRVPHASAGKRGRCPKCRQPIAIPAPDDPVAPPPAESVGDDDLLDQLATGTAVESPEERRARLDAATARTHAKPAGRGAPTPTVRVDWGARIVAFGAAYLQRDLLSNICRVALVVGGALIFFGFKETRLRQRWSFEPQQLTCAATGPGDNLHVLMSDFILLPAYVYEQKMADWVGAWVPAVSPLDLDRAVAVHLGVPVQDLVNTTLREREEALDGTDVASLTFRVLVSFPEADGELYIERMAEQETIQGTILNDFASLDGDAQRLLRESYPAVNVADCWILVAGREAFSMATTQLYYAGGLLGVLVSLAVASWRAVKAAE